MTMRAFHTILALMIAAAAGCDDRGGSDAPPPPTRTRVSSDLAPPALPPATQSPAVAARPPSVLTIDGKTVLFPAGKVGVMSNKPGDLRVRLCTDDPADAVDPGYAGNSFLFDMKLGVDSIDKVPGLTWNGTAGDFDPDAGLYVGGFRNPYRPHDVRVTFTKGSVDWDLYLSGTFDRSDPSDPFAPTKSVPVTGHLSVPGPGK